MRGSPTGQLCCALLRASLLCLWLGMATPALGASVDTDGDTVPDVSDDCPLNPNAHQEDSDGDGIGDVCDPDTINPILEANTLVSELHARTPFHRGRIQVNAGSHSYAFGPEAGVGGAANGGIGIRGSDDSEVSTLSAIDLVGFGSLYVLGAEALVQSTWQTAVVENVFTAAGGPPPIHAYVSSHANGLSVAYELDPSLVDQGEDAGVQHLLSLPAGWTLDTSELGSGIGRLTLRDGGGVARMRISPAEVVAFGRQTVVQDSATFFGLTRLTQELESSAATATVGPPDLVGSNASGGIEAPLVQTSYTLEENLADSALGTTTVTPSGEDFVLGMIAPGAVIDRNRATSSRMLVGWRISSLTAVDFGTAATVNGSHLVFFDEEVDVVGADTTLALDNASGTFDGAPPDYGLFPNNGGTAALYDAASQHQTAFGCAGCTMSFSGELRIDFEGGGVGVGIGPGLRVGPGDPCLVSDPFETRTNTGRCAVDRNKRGSFSAEHVAVTGSMSGLVAGESDVAISAFHFTQRADPNVTDPTLLHTVMGLGCAADAGVRIGVNPSNGDVTGNVPLDLMACRPEDVGAGLCLPSALSSPPALGACNIHVVQMELIGIGSPENPDMDLTKPSGIGLAAVAARGSGDFSARRYDPISGRCEGVLGEPSAIKGFQVGASFSGGANVDEATGEARTYDDPGAVPPNVFCLDNVLFDDNEMGLLVAGNVDLRATHLQIERTMFGAVHLANGSANVETVASTSSQGSACPTIDDVSCVAPAQELACPGCTVGGEHYLAISGSGKSAPTRLAISDSILGLDESGVSSGANPALPPLVLDASGVATGGGLTVARRLAGLHLPPLYLSKGPDTMFETEMLSLSLTGSNVGVNGAAIAIDNLDSPEGALDAVLDDNCYTRDGTSCIGAGGPTLVAAAAPDAVVPALDALARSNAASSPKPGAGIVLPEPALPFALGSGVALLGLLHRRRVRRLGVDRVA